MLVFISALDYLPSKLHLSSCSKLLLRIPVLLAVLSCFLICGAAATCPTGCECSGSRMRCASWAHAQPPEADRATYQELDLAADGGTTNNTALSRGDYCYEIGKGSRRSVFSPCDAPPGTLGSALDRGFLPANWLGDDFGYLTALSLRGAGLCAMHKDAFRPQARLAALDLSANRLRRVNVFIIRKNLKLQKLSLAENPELELPPDGTVIYSDSIKQLDLSECSICHLPEKVFAGMPKLESVKLSGNCLRELSTAPLSKELAPGLARLDLSANLVQGLATEQEDATALARLTAIKLSDNNWTRECDAVHANESEVTLSDGTVTTWHDMSKRCVAPAPAPEPTPPPEATTPEVARFREASASPETTRAPPPTTTPTNKRNLPPEEPSSPGRRVQEDDVTTIASWWLTVAACCMNVTTSILLIYVFIRDKKRKKKSEERRSEVRPNTQNLLTGKDSDDEYGRSREPRDRVPTDTEDKSPWPQLHFQRKPTSPPPERRGQGGSFPRSLVALR